MTPPLSCSDPVNIYLGGLAVTGSVSFVRDWHATVQTVGLWGLLLTTGNWVRKTDDPAVRPPHCAGWLLMPWLRGIDTEVSRPMPFATWCACLYSQCVPAVWRAC